MSQAVEKINALLLSAQQRYEARNPHSKQLHLEAADYLPGGNTRSVLHASPFPLCMARGESNRLTDEDGHEYIDFLGEMTAGLYGHSHPAIKEAITSTMSTIGLNLGGTTAAETSFAKALATRFAAIEQLRFCNSGTEANLYALSVARQATGLSKVIIFHGGYHGGVLYFARGIAANNVDKGDWIVGVYNDVEGARELITANKGVAAAVIVEAMQGAAGCIPGTAEFLHTVQESARENGIVFILDEVITSRLAPGGLQSVVKHPNTGEVLKPDLVTVGKWIGGGLAIGAFGGKRELMSVYDPRSGRVSHSGTFNNNTLVMNVGWKAVTEVYTGDACRELNALGDRLRSGLQEVAGGTKMVVMGLGGVMNIHFLPGGQASTVARVQDLQVEAGGVEDLLKDLLWFYLVERGFWIARRGMISLVLGTTEEEIQQLQDVVRRFLEEHRDLVQLS